MSARGPELCALTLPLFEEIKVNLKKHIFQTLSQGIKKYWNVIHKYDKFMITVTEWNWKCSTQLKK